MAVKGVRTDTQPRSPDGALTWLDGCGIYTRWLFRAGCHSRMVPGGPGGESSQIGGYKAGTAGYSARTRGRVAVRPVCALCAGGAGGSRRRTLCWTGLPTLGRGCGRGTADGLVLPRRSGGKAPGVGFRRRWSAVVVGWDGAELRVPPKQGAQKVRMKRPPELRRHLTAPGHLCCPSCARLWGNGQVRGRESVWWREPPRH